MPFISSIKLIELRLSPGDTMITDPLTGAEYRTLAHAALALEEEYFDVPRISYEKLERVLYRAKTEINTRQDPTDVLSGIGRLLKEEGFDYKKNKSISHSLANPKETDCKGFSVLYHSIGEVLELPIKLVGSPDHVSVVWDDGDKSIFWETTRNFETNRDLYIKKKKICQEAIENGSYLRPLNEKEVVGILYTNRGIARNFCEDFEEARKDFDQALTLNLRCPGTLINRDNAESDLGNLRGAIEDYNRALALNPRDLEALNNRGAARSGLGDFKGTIEDCNQVLSHDPKCPEALSNRGTAKRKLKDPDYIPDLLTALELKPEMFTESERFLIGVLGDGTR